MVREKSDKGTGGSEMKPYWYIFYEWYCALCSRSDVVRRRVYDVPKPKEWNERHLQEEGTCDSHFM